MEKYLLAYLALGASAYVLILVQVLIPAMYEVSPPLQLILVYPVLLFIVVIPTYFLYIWQVLTDTEGCKRDMVASLRRL